MTILPTWKHQDSVTSQSTRAHPAPSIPLQTGGCGYVGGGGLNGVIGVLSIPFAIYSQKAVCLAILVRFQLK